MKVMVHHIMFYQLLFLMMNGNGTIENNSSEGTLSEYDMWTIFIFVSSESLYCDVPGLL